MHSSVPADVSILPPGVGRWSEETKHLDCLKNYSFLVLHDDFLELLGPNPQLVEVADSNAHEGLVYYPDENAILFTTQGDIHTIPNKVKKLCLETKKQESIFPETDFANGMTLDRDGNLLICEQGSEYVYAYIQKVNLKVKPIGPGVKVADKWSGHHFNGPNDIVVKSDGSIWFTDPDYPREQQKFKRPSEVKNQLYRIGTDGTVDAVDDSFIKPNGLAFSPDESKLYVTDTGHKQGEGGVDDSYHNVSVFDVVDGRHLKNKCPFASIYACDGSQAGSPDGIKVDTAGRVYIGTIDGVQVFSDKGVLLGLIQVPEAVTIGFGGPLLDTLYIFDDKAVRSTKLRTVGAGLPYAGKFHNIPYYNK